MALSIYLPHLECSPECDASNADEDGVDEASGDGHCLQRRQGLLPARHQQGARRGALWRHSVKISR